MSMPLHRRLTFTEFEHGDTGRIREGYHTANGRLRTRYQVLHLWEKHYSQEQIADAVDLSIRQVQRIEKRYTTEGLDGLLERPRSGRPTKYDQETVKAVLAVLDSPTENGCPAWRVEDVSLKTGIPAPQIYKILANRKICLQVVRTWCVSTDPDFKTKQAAIVKWYNDTNDDVVVLCMDEVPNLWLSHRGLGWAPNGKRVQRATTSTYESKGRTHLFAIQNFKTGEVFTEFYSRKRRTELIDFLNKYFAEYYDPQKQYVLIWDNYTTHSKIDVVLDKFPNLTLVYTPTHASWLNHIETWNNTFTRLFWKGNSFTSMDDFFDKAGKFIEYYNKRMAHPGKFKNREVKGSQLRDSAENCFYPDDMEEMNNYINGSLTLDSLDSTTTTEKAA